MLILLITSTVGCRPSQDVVGSGWTQKRKYRRGFHWNVGRNKAEPATREINLPEQPKPLRSRAATVELTVSQPIPAPQHRTMKPAGPLHSAPSPDAFTTLPAPSIAVSRGEAVRKAKPLKVQQKLSRSPGWTLPKLYIVLGLWLLSTLGTIVLLATFVLPPSMLLPSALIWIGLTALIGAWLYFSGRRAFYSNTDYPGNAKANHTAMQAGTWLLVLALAAVVLLIVILLIWLLASWYFQGYCGDC